jgi:UDP-glucose 4-epimerase
VTPCPDGEVINIGNDREITMNDLARLVKKLSGSSSPIVHIPYSSAYSEGFEDMERRVPCLNKLKLLAGSRPETPIETIVQAVLDHERLTSRAWAVPPARVAAGTACAATFGD